VRNRLGISACAFAVACITFSFVAVAGADTTSSDNATGQAARTHHRAAQAQSVAAAPTANPAPMRYYGGPKSPMWPAAR